MSNQYLKLRRSGVPGKIPSTSSIDYGEIALNTYDGVAYMKRSGSNGEEVVGFNSGSFSGSFQGTFTGSFTGSLEGTASWAENFNEIDPIFTAVSGTFTTTASFNAFTSSYYNDSASFNSRTISNSASIALLSSSFTSFSSSYNTGSFTGSFSGSLYGTASWAENAVTAAFAPAYLPLTGGTINGNVTVNGTASIAFLNVTIQSSSVIYSSGSNIFGDATNDTQTLIGTVIVSGSQQITGSLRLSTPTYNTSSINVLTYNTGSSEVEYSTINDLTFTKNIVTVGLTGSRNVRYNAIKTAVDSITDSSENNRYVIEVGPGQFIENTIDLTGKPYVSIVGSSIQTTQIFPSSSNQHIIKLGVNNEVSFLSLANAGPGYAALYVDDIGDFGQAHKLAFYNCDTNVFVISRTQDTQFYGEYLDYNGTYSYGTRVSASNGFTAIANIENYYQFPSASGGTVIGNLAEGTGAELNLYVGSFLGEYESGSTAIQLSDGAIMEAGNLDIQGWGYGINIPNVGSAPTFRAVGTMIHDSVEYDIYNANSATQGRFQGISDHTKITNNSPDIYWNFLDDNDGENDVTRKLSVTFADGTHTDATTLIFKGSSMGLLQGGEITISGSLTVTIAAGYGYLHDSINPEVFKRFDWVNQNITLPPNTNNYIFINSNGILSNLGTTPNFAQNIILGRVVTNDTEVELIDQSPWNAEHTANRLSKFNREALGPIFAEGSTITENVTPFTLDVSQGNYYFSENNFLPAGTSSINLTQYYPSASVWARYTSSIVPNNVYASGSQLVAMSASYYTKHTVYLVGDGVDEDYFLVINDNQYATLVETEGAILPNIPTYFNDGVVPLAAIYVRSGSSNITQIQDIRPVIGFRAAGVNASSVHGNLLGLNADDHTQYIRGDGFRQMVGNLGLGGNNIYNVNNISGSSITVSTANIDTLNVASITGSLSGNASTATTASFALSGNGLFSGSFSGSGANLFGIPASGIVGLNLAQIATGSVTASVSLSQFTVTSGSSTELVVRGTGVTIGNAITDAHTITGSLNITGSVSAVGLTQGSGSSHVIMYNTASGQFFFTASAAIGGGGGNASNDNFQQIFLLMGG